MRTNVNNSSLPGVQSEDEFPTEHQKECAIYQDGDYIGNIVYVASRRRAGTEYGWRPAKAAAQSRLSTKEDAIRRLPKFSPSARDRS